MEPVMQHAGDVLSDQSRTTHKAAGQAGAASSSACLDVPQALLDAALALLCWSELTASTNSSSGSRAGGPSSPPAAQKQAGKGSGAAAGRAAASIRSASAPAPACDYGWTGEELAALIGTTRMAELQQQQQQAAVPTASRAAPALAGYGSQSLPLVGFRALGLAMYLRYVVSDADGDDARQARVAQCHLLQDALTAGRGAAAARGSPAVPAAAYQLLMRAHAAAAGADLHAAFCVVLHVLLGQLPAPYRLNCGSQADSAAAVQALLQAVEAAAMAAVGTRPPLVEELYYASELSDGSEEGRTLRAAARAVLAPAGSRVSKAAGGGAGGEDAARVRQLVEDWQAWHAGAHATLKGNEAKRRAVLQALCPV